MSNTQLRIISALAMLFLVIGMVYLGQVACALFVGIAGFLLLEEVFNNFFNVNRKYIKWIIIILGYLIPYLFLHFAGTGFILEKFWIYLGLGFNLLMICYLFFFPIDVQVIRGKHLWWKALLITSLLVALINVSKVFYMENWRLQLATVFFVNFGMDTGAWFFGRKFGKTKLWEKVSPKKTWEGLLGGMFTAMVAGGVVWAGFGDSLSTWMLPVFALFGALSQVGDLVQSKFKRQFDIKDSSALIPGHGGVYDRIDSLLFLTPFYLIVFQG